MLVIKLEELKKYVSIRVSRLLKEHRISRYRLTELTGVSEATLSKIYNQKEVPSLETICKICNGLNITLSEFFKTPDDYEKALSDDEKEEILFWMNLTQKEKQFMRGVLSELNKYEDDNRD